MAIGSDATPSLSRKKNKAKAVILGSSSRVHKCFNVTVPSERMAEVEPQTWKEALEQGQNDPMLTGPPIGFHVPYSEDTTVRWLQARQIEDLQAQVKAERKRFDDLIASSQTTFLKQLDREREKKHQIDRLVMDKCRLNQRIEEQAKEMETMKKWKLQQERVHDIAIRDWNRDKTRLEHAHAEIKTLEEDLAQLRQIENEDAANRRRRAQGLPPAYGALDDEDFMAANQIHRDDGSVEVARLKRAVRTDFVRKLDYAQVRRDSLRTFRTPDQADAVIFIVSSLALAESSRRLKVALDHPDYVSSSHCVTSLDARLKAGSDNMKPSAAKREIKRQTADQEFVADRMAKMIIDLGWRTVAACELRPNSAYYLTPNEQTKIRLAYTEIDECLLQALRVAFKGCRDSPTTTSSAKKQDAQLWELQYFFTQLCSLRLAFANILTTVLYHYFHKSTEWVAEQVEEERMRRANRPDLVQQPTEEQLRIGTELMANLQRYTDGDQEFQTVVSEVSSEGPRSGSASESEIVAER